MIIKWAFTKEKNSKKEDKHMGSQKRCRTEGWKNFRAYFC